MSASTPPTTMPRPIWRPSGKRSNALKSRPDQVSRRHGSATRACLRGSIRFRGEKNNVEETAHLPQPSNGNRGAPSHYGLLLITREMASSPFFEPRGDVACVVGDVARKSEGGAHEKARQFGSQFFPRIG